MIQYRSNVFRCLMMALVLVWCLSGCAVGGPTTEDIQKKMNASLDGADALLLSSSMEAHYRMPGESEETVVTADGRTQVDRSNRISDSEWNLKITDGEEKKTRIRIVEADQGSSVTRYISREDAWTRQTDTEPDGLPVMELLERIRDYKDVMLRSPELCTVDGAECYELKAFMAPMDLASLIHDVFRFGIEMEPELADAVVADGAQVTASLYVDRETGMLRRMVVEEDLAETSESDAAEEESRDEADVTDDAVAQVLGNILPGVFASSSPSITDVTLTVDVQYPVGETLVLPDEMETVEETTVEETEAPEVRPEKPEPSYETLEILTQYAPKFYDLCGDDSIHVYLTRIAKTPDDSLLVSLNLVNDSDQVMDLYAESIAVNHTMFEDVSFYEKVEAHESRKCWILIRRLSQHGITDVGSLTVRFIADDAEMNQELFETRDVTYVIREENDSYMIPETENSRVIYEDENLRITAIDIIEGEKTLEIPVFVENLSDCYFAMSTTKVTDELGQPLDMKLVGTMLPHSCMVSRMSLNLDYIDSLLRQLPREIHIAVNTTDLYTLTTPFPVDEVVILCTPEEAEVETEADTAETETTEAETTEAEETPSEETREEASGEETEATHEK